jgi:surfeit locus 1 family protein
MLPRFAGAPAVSARAFSFHPRAIPTLAAIAMIALTASLGRWQLGRAGEKVAIQSLLEARMSEQPVVVTGALDAEAMRYRRATASGEYWAGGQVFLDNQQDLGRAGYHVLTPLALAPGGPYLLVNRGWVARGAQYPKPPAVDLPHGRVEVAGLLVPPVKRFLELSGDVIDGSVWQNLKLDQWRNRTGKDVLALVLVSDSPAAGLVKVAERPAENIDMHRGYAFQWFALATAVLVLWVVLNVKRR